MENYYVDTSVIAAYYCPESFSTVAQGTLQKVKQPKISNLTEVELRSTLAKKICRGELKHDEANLILNKFNTQLIDGYCTKTHVLKKHYKLAHSWLSSFKTSLRTLDALQLAVSFDAGFTLITLDKNQANSAKPLGINTLELTNLSS